MSAGPPQQPPIDLAYETPPRRSRSALTALALGIFALVPLLGIPFAVAAIVFAVIALRHIRRPPHNTTGNDFALAAIICSLFGLTVSPIYFVAIARARERGNQSYCAANLRGITQSIIIYSNENGDLYPTLPFAPYSPSNAGTSATTGTADEKTTIEGMYAKSSPLAGSPLASVWLLVMCGQTTPKQFICKSDPAATAIGQLFNPAGELFTNFQADNQVSYSFAYPYTPAGEAGVWWRNANYSLPVMADMAPLNGTGSPARNVTPGSSPSNNRIWNSANHQGDGENVAFSDTHVEFSRRPDIGEANDNIYSMTGTKGVSDFGGVQPGKSPINLWTDAPPFDIVLVPSRRDLFRRLAGFNTATH